MKNEYFQENLKKRIKITREMILSEDQMKFATEKVNPKEKDLNLKEENP